MCPLEADCVKIGEKFACECKKDLGYRTIVSERNIKYHLTQRLMNITNDIRQTPYGTEINTAIPNAGFFGTNCSDINECAEKNSCSENALCQNTKGGFDCMCKSGIDCISRVRT